MIRYPDAYGPALYEDPDFSVTPVRPVRASAAPAEIGSAGDLFVPCRCGGLKEPDRTTCAECRGFVPGEGDQS